MLGDDEATGSCYIGVSTKDFVKILKDYFLSLTKSKVSFPSTIELTPFFSNAYMPLKYFENMHPSCVVIEN